MPTTYTHDIFGKEVYKRLPSEIKESIRESKSMYLIGLHGPDILFYYQPLMKNRVSGLGHQVHQREAAEFFCQAVVKYQEEPTAQMLSYLLGFGCHYILDSTCHPYVRRFEKETGASHSEIESELDRYYMLREGKDPFTYRPAVNIFPTMEGCRTISRAFGKITVKQAAKALHGMRFYTGTLVCSSSLKRKGLLGIMKLFGCRDTLGGHIIPAKPDRRCDMATDVLRHLYEEALDEAVEALTNLYGCMVKEERLSQRFGRNFG